MIMGIDAGNFETKVCTERGVYSFISDIGEYRERKLNDSFGPDDIVWEYNGERGFAGTLAKYESEFGGTIKGKSKANADAVLRTLIAIHRYGGERNEIIVGQPIDSHDEDEKAKIKSALQGKHDISINGERKRIFIDKVNVAPEGPSAILSNPDIGLIRVIDIGSGTTNFASLINLRRIDKDSFTHQIGTETTKTKNPKDMANKIYKIVSATWDMNDEIYVVGGGAERVYEYLKNIMPNSRIFKPKIGIKTVHTKFSNACGFYAIAKGLYEYGKY